MSIQIAPDKAAHFLGGWALVAMLQAHTGFSVAWALCVVVAAGKELRDRTGFGTYDPRDFWVTVTGGMLAALAELLLASVPASFWEALPTI